jgi:esterase/lipase
MKKKIYIFPGWEDKATDEGYDSFLNIAKNKDYELVRVDIDWKKTLSSQIIEVEKDSILIGFSLGAIFAWLISQKYECEYLVLSSMTPHNSFKDKEIKKLLIDLCGSEFTNDISDNLQETNKAKKQCVMYGDKEGEAGDIIVKDTDHELNKNYFIEIEKYLSV